MTGRPAGAPLHAAAMAPGPADGVEVERGADVMLERLLDERHSDDPVPSRLCA